MQTVTSADGTSIAYEQHGNGEPLVLLHGGGTRRYWDPVLPRFTDEYTVVVPDRRGRGDSGDSDQYSLDREVEDALAVVDAVDGKPVLYGHSFGGLQAIEAARKGPIRTVVAYEPAILVEPYRSQADLADVMERLLDDGKRRETMKRHLGEVLHSGHSSDLDQWLDEWPGWPACVENLENTIRMNRAIEEYRLPDTLDLDAPSLLLTGTEGPSHLRDSVRAVHEAHPASRLVEFDDVGHNGPVAAPERVTATVLDFIASADRD